MSRRLTTADLHPSVFDLVHQAAYSGGMAADGMGSPAYSNFGSVWLKEYWKGFLAWLIGFFCVISLIILTKDHFSKGTNVIFLLGGMGLWMGLGVALYNRNRQMATWEEIEALRPLMKASDCQDAYLDCVKCVLESRVLEDSQKQSWLASLNASLDQALQLEDLDREMRKLLGGDSATGILAERNVLAAKVVAAQDPVSREAFKQSLEMVDDRIRRSSGLAAQAERAEAHLELTKQTFLKTREVLTGLTIGSRHATQFDLEPLRANLARAQDESVAIRSAIDEIAQLRNDALL